MGEKMREYKKQYQIICPNITKELAHGCVVSKLTHLVGQRLGLPEEELHDVMVAAFLHDIGKLELVKYIGGKNMLVIEELKYIRTHSTLGALILIESGYSREIVEMVKCHHENCDGSGYPGNLSKEEIPYGARIIRVCDAFAALTGDRPYRKAFGIDQALQIMINESRYYDLKAFLALMAVVHTCDIKSILDTRALEDKLVKLLAEGDNMFLKAVISRFDQNKEEEKL